jgi:hypothetical protein
MINILYSILVDNPSPTANPLYVKRRSAVLRTDRMTKLLNILMSPVPKNKLEMFASTICYLLKLTEFSSELQKLDPQNTYVPPERPQGVDNNNQAYCLYNAIGQVDHYKEALPYLDKDLQATIADAPTWLDYVGGICIQLLREVTA